jgi:hypothetical protein
MTFALTKYIFPLKNEIEFSNFKKYVFDNPRTNSELKIVKDFINKTILEDCENCKNSTIAPMLTRLGLSIEELRHNLTKSNPDCFALKYFNSFETKEYIDILAETWIIIRFPEQLEFYQISKDRAELYKHILTNKESAYSLSYKELSNYCYLISLLSHDNDTYHGESFLLLDNPYGIFFSQTNMKVYDTISRFQNMNSNLDNYNRQTNWLYWFDSFQHIISSAKQIDSLMVQEKVVEKNKRTRQSQKQTPCQKLLHFGNLLQSAYQHLNDPGLMLLILVSCIEYLITRNPESTKFNVEDSISKQFYLKCAVLIHSQNKNYNLVKLKQELTQIYTQRSNYAHGNFKENIEIEEIIKSVHLLYRFNRDFINAFINDRQLIEYLKDN